MTGASDVFMRKEIFYFSSFANSFLRVLSLGARNLASLSDSLRQAANLCICALAFILFIFHTSLKRRNNTIKNDLYSSVLCSSASIFYGFYYIYGVGFNFSVFPLRLNLFV